MKLKTGAVNRKPREVEIDGAKFYIVPLSSELHTDFVLYASNTIDTYFGDREKRKFIKQHVVDWSGLIVEEDGKEKEMPYSNDIAIELLLDPDADELLSFLYSQSLSFRQSIDEKTKEDKEKGKK